MEQMLVEAAILVSLNTKDNAEWRSIVVIIHMTDCDATEYTTEERQNFANNPSFYLEYRHELEAAMNKSQVVTFRGTETQKKFWEEADKFMKAKLAEKPEIYESLLPPFPPGCRRLTPGPGYLEALLQDNVTFIGSGVVEVDHRGIRDQKGGYNEVDAIICATGFD